MLYERMMQAKKTLQENKVKESNFKDTYYENEEKITGQKETVLIGHDYIDENDESNRTLELEILIPDPESPNDLDCDTDLEDTVSTVSDEEVDKEVEDTLVNLSEYAEALTPTIEQKEESMDVLCKDSYSEDTSGKTYSEVQKFLDKYAEGNDIIQVLIKNLMAVVADIQYIKESNNQHEQWALDYADALNELSVSL